MSLYEGLIWREKPAGPEQLELERMFKAKEIPFSATPDSVRQKVAMFAKFNARVFACHFRKTKAKFEVFAANGNEGTESSGSVQIPKLGAPVVTTSPSSSSMTVMELLEEPRMDIWNPPFCVWKFTDHHLKSDFVCVVVTVFSGIKKFKFELSEDGMQVILNYNWPSAIYKAKELFHNQMRAKQIGRDHPKVHAFTSHLLQCDITENSEPKGRMIIDLPCQVKRDDDSYKKEAVNSNGTQIILLQFMAYRKNLIIQDADTTIEFD